MNIKEYNLFSTIIGTTVITFIIYAWTCLKMYKRRSKIKVLIDFDSVIVSIDHLHKRAEIYVKNHPETTIGEYIGAHINEQEIKPEGIRKALQLQNQFYQLVFVSNRDASLRVETAKVLNQWGLRGQLFMNPNPELKKNIIQSGEINGLLDWSEQHDFLMAVGYKNITDFS